MVEEPEEPITLTDVMAKLVEIHKDQQAGFKRVDGELGAIRNVVDHDLASHDQLLIVEARLLKVEQELRRLNKERA